MLCATACPVLDGGHLSFEYCKFVVMALPPELMQDAQLSQRDRAAGCVTVFAKSRRRLELGDDILRTVI